jgi:hypothetical protein
MPSEEPEKEAVIESGVVTGPTLLLDMVIPNIVSHWDKKEDLCAACMSWWEILPTAFRDEVRHNYEFDKDEA